MRTVAYAPRLSFLLMCRYIAYIPACTRMPKLSEYVSAVIVMLMNRGIKPLSMSYYLMHKKGSLWFLGPVDEWKTLYLLSKDRGLMYVISYKEINEPLKSLALGIGWGPLMSS